MQPNNELLRAIEQVLNPEELVDILGLTIEQLTIHLEEVIIDNREKFADLEPLPLEGYDNG